MDAYICSHIKDNGEPSKTTACQCQYIDLPWMSLTCAWLQSPQLAEQAQQQAEQAQQQAEQAQQQAQQAQQQAEQAQQAVVKVQQEEQGKPAGQATAPPLSDQKTNKDSSSGFFSARVSLAFCAASASQDTPLTRPAVALVNHTAYNSHLQRVLLGVCLVCIHHSLLQQRFSCESAYVEARETATAASCISVANE